MTQRLLKGGHRVVVYDSRNEAIQGLVERGAAGSNSIDNLVSQLARRRAVWLMVPPGAPTESTVNKLAGLLSPGDIVMDGGNSNYKDSVRRAGELEKKGIFLLDIGTSGGIWGLTEGYCLMVGGMPEAYEQIKPALQTLAPSPREGYGHVGPSGAGHFVKMIHNGIEYALMEGYAEGFELMRAKKEFPLDLSQVAEIWRSGSVVRSWLLDLAAAALKEDPGLESIQGYVEDSGEGKWTVQEAADLAVPIPAIAGALQVRFRSRQEQPFGPKLLAALRNQFGGHPLKKAGD